MLTRVGFRLFLPALLLGCQKPGGQPVPPSSPMPSAAVSSAPSPAVASPTHTLAGLPAEVGDYVRWLKLNPQPLPPRADAPHGSGVKNVFVNRSREQLQSFPYPDGTWIVKEAWTAKQDYIEVIALMRKQHGSDPAHGDWIFEEY
ncbi:MAG TPA: hypothetical protein V6D23_22340, partial [Candidatus Obscuribacterales bacterium]